MASEPDLRILQANERTLLAWIRTGLTLMALGFVLARMNVWLKLQDPEHRSTATLWIGVVVVGLGTACQLVGATRFVHARRAIVEGRPIVPAAAGPVAVAIAVIVIGVAALVFLIGTG